MLSTFLNTTDHKTSVSLPYSSELIKLEILPKKIPIGAEAEIKSKNICMAGGVALNSVANQKLFNETNFEA